MSYRSFYYATCLLLLLSCTQEVKEVVVVPRPAEAVEPELSEFAKKLSNAALERLKHKVTYDGRYMKIAYPGGDVPENIGVCTDEVIRSYRALGIDLQKEVHEEMRANFKAYPNLRKWGLHTTDTNIDHRRVPNLQVFFARKGIQLETSNDPKHYFPGDLVTWDVQGLPHIGIVVNRKIAGSNRYMIVHNIGNGPMMEDMLFNFPITGHYRYDGSKK